jgi:hypothetical protein
MAAPCQRRQRDQSDLQRPWHAASLKNLDEAPFIAEKANALDTVDDKRMGSAKNCPCARFGV